MGGTLLEHENSVCDKVIHKSTGTCGGTIRIIIKGTFKDVMQSVQDISESHTPVI